MKIVSLIDNNRLRGRKDLHAEQGLSLSIATPTQHILFDTGLSGSFLTNAAAMKIDIAQVTLAVLSHHHFDHGGGLETFFKANAQAQVYLRSSSTERFYLHLFGILTRRIGLDLELFEKYPQRFSYTDQFTEIAPDVFILTAIKPRHPAPRGNRHLFVHTNEDVRLETFEHELILVVRENGKLVVFTGCSHNGILNMLDAVVEQFPGQAIKALFGGFHLIDLPLFNTLAGSKEDVANLGRAILQYPIEMVYTGHCTGQKGYRILKKVMGEKLEYFATGCQAEV